MVDSKCFQVSLEDGVAHLQLCRPEAYNTMTPEFWRELPALVDEISDAGRARAIVLSSTGKHFTAGMDLAVFQTPGGLGSTPSVEELGRKRAALREEVLLLQRSFTALENARMPVIAAIQGACIGGGVDMISACDMRYCTEDAYFCIQEINIGLTADVGTLQRLPKLIPDGVVRELAYTGRRLPAARAKEVGLVNEIFPSHQALLEGAMAVAREIAARSPLAILGSKEMIRYVRDHSVADGLNYIATWQSGMFFGGDMMETFRAKQEKRAPEFEDLPPLRRKP
jgi:enoyl-CoA hydratase